MVPDLPLPPSDMSCCTETFSFKYKDSFNYAQSSNIYNVLYIKPSKTYIWKINRQDTKKYKPAEFSCSLEKVYVFVIQILNTVVQCSSRENQRCTLLALRTELLMKP